MCEFSGKLIAWMDGELPADEAAEVEQHIVSCAECRSGLDAYKRVSCELEALCEAQFAIGVRRETRHWLAPVCAAGAVAALLALFLVWPRMRVEPQEFHLSHSDLGVSPTVVEDPLFVPIRPVARVHSRTSAPGARSFAVRKAGLSAPPQNESAVFPLPNEPVFQIAIPAEDIFPPGAVPPGMNFAADVAIAADGSAERLRLRPRLVGFERSNVQP
jgi:anti-sigma factor RsiW